MFERAYEPGKEYRLRLKDESNEREVMRSNGQIVKEEDKTKVLSFVGTRKVLSAGEDQPSEYLVEELTQTLNGQASVVLPPGTKILASPAGKEWRYTVEQQPLPKEVDELVGSLFGRTIGGPGDDDIFGTKEPRAVGEQWPVDPARLPADDDIVFDVSKASGSTRVVSLRTVEGVECLEIEAKLSIPKLTLKGFPAEAKMLEATMSGSFLGLFPTDEKRLSLSQGMSLDMAMKMEIMSPSGPIVADMTMHNENTVSRE